MILRDYQSEAVRLTFDEWKECTSSLIVQPTGTGKTVTFAEIIRRMMPARSMVIAHREELIFQARDKISKVTGATCEIEMGEYKTNESGLFGRASCIVSTVQTLTSGGDGGGRIGKFDPLDFGLLVIDEAHHATSASYRKVIKYFSTNPNLKILGVTATPDRADEEALGQAFETVAFDYEILDAIRDGWLLPIDQQMVSVDSLDFSAVRTTAGDLNGADLAAVVESRKNLYGIASASVDIIGQRRALVFAASVNQASALCEIFNSHRTGMSAWVCGKTDRDERRQILANFAAGKLQVVCNCGVLTEGFDDPGVEVIIMGRPTKSRSLYSQMVGRSTRPLPGIVDGPETADLRRQAIALSTKPSCLVVDFVGNSGQHKLITSADILGGKVSDEAIERAISTSRKSGKPMRMDELLDDEEKKIKEERRIAEELRRSKLAPKAKFSTKYINPFDALNIEPAKPRAWDEGKTLSEKQRSLLTKQGVDPDSMPYAQAKQLIKEMFRRWDENLCTIKQANWLRKHGYSPNTKINDASRIMDSWAKNGWQRPPIPPPPSYEEMQGYINAGSVRPEATETHGPAGSAAEIGDSENIPF